MFPIPNSQPDTTDTHPPTRETAPTGRCAPAAAHDPSGFIVAWRTSATRDAANGRIAAESVKILKVDAAHFNAIFDEVVAPPLIALGFTRKGRRLNYEQGTVQASLARTEPRWIPPARLTFFFRHRFLRDVWDTVPTSMPTNPNDFPLQFAPSDLCSVASGTWRYEQTLAGIPSDSVDYPRLAEIDVRLALAKLASDVATAFPFAIAAWTPAAILERIKARGDEAWWVEKLWLADYEHYLREPTTCE